MCSNSRADCERCNGSGKVEFFRCPGSMMTREVVGLIDSYTAFKDSGVLPAPGALCDQSRVWWRWIKVIENERAVIEEERAALERAKANAARSHGR